MRDEEYLRALLEQNPAMGRQQQMGMPAAPYGGGMGRQQPQQQMGMPTAPYGGGNIGKGHLGRMGKAKASFNPVGVSFTLVALALGGLAWLVGARYTIDGIIWMFNLAMATVGESYRLEASRNLYLGMLVIPIIFSMVEWGMGKLVLKSEWETRILWAVVILIDLTTTGFGLAATEPGDLGILAWAVSSLLPIIGITFFLTFWPEWILKWGWRKLRVGWNSIAGM